MTFQDLQHQLLRLAELKSYRHHPIPFPLLLKGLKVLSETVGDELDDGWNPAFHRKLREIDFPEEFEITFHSGETMSILDITFLESIWRHYVQIHL